MKGTMDFEPLDREAMTEYVHKAGGEVIKKGCDILCSIRF